LEGGGIKSQEKCSKQPQWVIGEINHLCLSKNPKEVVYAQETLYVFCFPSAAGLGIKSGMAGTGS